MCDEISDKVALITGGARRVGRAIVEELHQNGMHVAVHYNKSEQDANRLVETLNARRANSAFSLSAELGAIASLSNLADAAIGWRGGVDLLVNNASSFFPTPFDRLQEKQWENLFSSNLKGPLFLAHALRKTLKQRKGNIVNIVDIYAQRPLQNYPLYSMAKSANAMMVKSLALELAPEIRVNGVSPGAILWPDQVSMSNQDVEQALNKVPLSRKGEPTDIANAVKFLACATYVTGQILSVDGGRSLRI